jgi:hypothetical protein
MITFSGSSSISSGGSISFNGSSQYLALASNAAFSFGTSDFTIETWIYPNSLSGRLWFFDSNSDNVDLNGNGGLFYYNAGIYSSATNTVISMGAWHHIALVRLSGTVTLYVNGSSVMSQAGIGFNSSSNRAIEIAYSSSQGNGYFNGLMTNFRVVKGTAVYTSAFTPSTSPLSAITNTQLLLKASSSGSLVTDSSTNNLTVTNNGTATFNSATPLVNFAGGGITITGGMTFANEAQEYTTNLLLKLDAATYSGSGAWVDSIGSKSFTLNGSPTWSSSIGGGSFNFAPASSQYASSATSLASQSTWTVEAWHYYDGTNSAGSPCIVSEQYPGVNSKINFSLGTNTSTGLQSGFFDGGWRTTTAYSLTAGNWYQIVGTYDGSTIKLYVNNSLVLSTNYAGTPSTSGGGIVLMRRWDLANYWGGKLGIVRIYSGDIGATAIAQNWNANKGRFGL